ncbi:MAG: hypothetical protein R3F55_22255 [Alphaproteobacteria bacterium]
MNPRRIAALTALFGALVASSSAMADGPYQLQQVQPPRLVPIMRCEVTPLGSGGGVWVFNGASVPFTLPQGTQLAWQTSGGLSGTFTVGAGGLEAGHGILVGTAPTGHSCSARVV